MWGWIKKKVIEDKRIPYVTGMAGAALGVILPICNVDPLFSLICAAASAGCSVMWYSYAKNNEVAGLLKNEVTHAEAIEENIANYVPDSKAEINSLQLERKIEGDKSKSVSRNGWLNLLSTAMVGVGTGLLASEEKQNQIIGAVTSSVGMVIATANHMSTASEIRAEMNKVDGNRKKLIDLQMRQSLRNYPTFLARIASTENTLESKKQEIKAMQGRLIAANTKEGEYQEKISQLNKKLEEASTANTNQATPTVLGCFR